MNFFFLLILFTNINFCLVMNIKLLFDLQEFFRSDLILIVKSETNDEFLKNYFKLKNTQMRAFVGAIDITKDLEIFFDKKYYFRYHNSIILTDGKNDVIRKLMNIKNFTPNLKASFIWVNFIKENIANILKEIFIPFNSRFLIIKDINNSNYEIQDVYQLSENSPLIFSNFALWKNEKLRVFEKDFFVKRMDLKGHAINVVTPFFEESYEKDKHLWELFSERMNFSINWVDTGGGIFHSNGSKTGLFKSVYEREVDGSPGFMTFSNERLDVYDYIFPTAIVETKLYVKDSVKLDWNSYLEPFSFKLWVTIALWIGIASIIIHIIFRYNRAIEFHIHENSFFYILSALCSQGSTLQPYSISLFISCLIPYILSVFLLQYYSGALLSFLSVKESGINFKNLEEIVEDGTYKLSLIDDTYEIFYFQTDPGPLATAVRNKKLLIEDDQIPLDTPTGFQQICENRWVLLIETDEVVRPKCDIVEIKKPAFVDSVGIIVWKGFPYKDVLTKVLKQIQFSGLVNFKGKSVILSGKEIKPFEPFGIDLVSPIFSSYFIFIILSSFIYFCEIIWSRKKTKKIKKRIRHGHIFKIKTTKSAWKL